MVITTLEEDELQTPLEIVQRKIFCPNPKFIAVVVPEVGVVIVADPKTIDHEPVPTDGIFPAIVKLGLEIHNVWLGPALATVGKLSTWILIVEVVVAQTPFEILHCKILIPNARPVTVDVGLFGLVIVPNPEITDHVPTPVVGVLAANVAFGELIQTVWLGPAVEILGAGSTMIVIVETVCGQAPLFVMLHCSTFVPSPTAVKLVVGLLILPIVALPEITDQVPTPLVGVFAAKVVVGFKTHIV